MDPMAAIRQTFFQECEEQLAETESGLLAMSEGHTDSETVNAVFRAVHSIKGGAGAFKLHKLVEFAHTFETALDHMRSGQLHPGADVLKVMLRAAGILTDLVEAARDGKEVDDSGHAGVADDIRSLTEHVEADDDDIIDFQPALIEIGAEPLPADPRKKSFSIDFRPSAALYHHANEPILILRELGRLGEMQIKCDTSDIPLLDALDPSQSYLSWKIDLAAESDRAAVTEVFEFVQDEAAISIDCESEPLVSDSDVAALIARANDGAAPEVVSDEAGETAVLPSGDIASGFGAGIIKQLTGEPAPQGAIHEAAQSTVATSSGTTAQATIRVEFDRVDRLINLVGELVINQAMLSQRVVEADIAGAGSILMGLDELEQLTREIQESVMAIRAQPVKPLFQRMSRIVRDVGDATGKQVRLKTEGDATEVDKTVVERLAEPLTHMIRNAVDHGIETPEVREAAGKPAEGVVKLTAAHRAGRIVIEISDDGAGINRAKVRESAIAKKLISADATLTDSEIDNLLFLPGFSTASTVSNISGRGVGMDVVKRSIQALGGRIGISSRPGLGSAFSLSLPLTLAVLDGMVVSVNQQTFVVPLTAIVETLKPKASEVHALGPDGRVMAIRNIFVPLIDVGKELGFRSTFADPGNCVAILVEAEDGGRCALLVDGIQDQRQVVIKSLEANYRSIPGIAAATILGDGRVALILDVNGIVTASRGEGDTELRMAMGA
ncbi:MAG: chemotaxis protein CheA [Hyphomicrobium sp.]